MIKNGRPYSISREGYEDTGLVSDFRYEEARKIDDWIRNNIRKSRSVYPTTSYGLKHLLEADTGIYMTNNAFKDAMLLSGYEPIDANKMNWQFRISMPRNEVYNTSPFFMWVKERYSGADGFPGKCAKDMAGDRDFPSMAEYGVIREYLEREWAAPGIIDAFEAIWERYAEETGRKGLEGYVPAEPEGGKDDI